MGVDADGNEIPEATEFTFPENWANLFTDMPEPLIAPVKAIAQSTIADYEARLAAVPGLDEDWKTFIENAKSVELTPAELVQSHNAQLTLQEELTTDPYGYAEKLLQEIDKAITEKRITPREGARAKLNLQQQVEEVIDEQQNPTLDTRTATELELQRQLDEVRASIAQQTTAAEERELEAASDLVAQAFSTTFDKVLDENAWLQEASDSTKKLLIDTALNYMDVGDGTVTPEQAIQTALKQLDEVRSPAAKAAAPTRMPIGGGGGAIPAEQTKKLSDMSFDEKVAAARALVQQLDA